MPVHAMGVSAPYLFVHLSDGSAARLLLRLHAPSWDDPLVWVATAAHQQHLEGERRRAGHDPATERHHSDGADAQGLR